MRALAVAAGIFTIAVLAAPAKGHRAVAPERPLVKLPLEQRERVQVRNLAHYRGAVRSLTAARRTSGLSPAQRHELVWHRLARGRATRGLAITRVLLGKATWLQTVAYVGRYYGAATARWLRSCSHPTSEGGWGRFVYNTQGSGAAGWLQFMPGTFYAYVGAAVRDARARGLRVPASARSVFSRLGQAVTGAFMYGRGLSFHWVGWGC